MSPLLPAEIRKEGPLACLSCCSLKELGGNREPVLISAFVKTSLLFSERSPSVSSYRNTHTFFRCASHEVKNVFFSCRIKCIIDQVLCYCFLRVGFKMSYC